MSATEETVSATITPPASETPPAPNAAAPDAAPSENQNVEHDDKGRFRNPLQPRIDELTRARREAEREAQFWRSRAETQAPAEVKPEKPTPDKFEDYGAYVEALTDWKADEKVNAKFEAHEKATAERVTASQRASTWEERRASFAKEVPDYDATMEASDVPIAQHVADELLESEQGPRIALHLAKNPQIAERLNKMTPTQAAREIGRLEVTLRPASAPNPDPVAPADDTPPPPKVRATQAPPPVKPISQGKATTTDLAKAGMDEYVETRRKQGASWARR